jgi:hypothetical protein
LGGLGDWWARVGVSGWWSRPRRILGLEFWACTVGFWICFGQFEFWLKEKNLNVNPKSADVLYNARLNLIFFELKSSDVSSSELLNTHSNYLYASFHYKLHQSQSCCTEISYLNPTTNFFSLKFKQNQDQFEIAQGSKSLVKVILHDSRIKTSIYQQQSITD